MLWGVVLFFLVMSIPAFFLAQRNRDSLMDAMAMHERLQRTDPEDPLAAVGPTEFQRAYERAVRKRGGALLSWVIVGLFAGLFVGIPIAVAIAWALDNVDLFGWLSIRLFPWRHVGRRFAAQECVRCDASDHPGELEVFHPPGLSCHVFGLPRLPLSERRRRRPGLSR